MDAGLPLTIHTELPRRPWDWKFERLPKEATVRPANKALLDNAEQLRASYARLLASEKYQFFTSPDFVKRRTPIDPLILPFVTALAMLSHLYPWESCQGLYHSKNGRINPFIAYHPISGGEPERDLCKVGEFLRNGPQDTYYQWAIMGHPYYGRVVLEITIPGLEMDPELATPPLVPEGVALHPLSQAVHDRVVLDVNALTLGFLLFQETYGHGLESFPPPGYYS